MNRSVRMNELYGWFWWDLYIGFGISSIQRGVKKKPYNWTSFKIFVLLKFNVKCSISNGLEC